MTTIQLNATNVRVIISRDDDSINVEACYVANTFAPIDRAHIASWGLTTKHAALALRLKNAIDAGAVFTSATRLTDVNGQTYLSPNWKAMLLGRTLNADLRRLGF